METNKLTYSQAMERLGTIVNDVENGRLDIDTICDKIKEAQQLINFCKDKLYNTDKAVNKLLDSPKGE